ncbi:MAG: hypothetical protein M3N32_01190 [Actinomycetota bacterium]|nr:hypothetical protein [Actinomycetota bacterium]
MTSRPKEPPKEPPVSDLLVTTHSVLRWVVLGVLLLDGAYALLQAPRPVPYRRVPFTLGVAIVDLQIALGIGLYVLNAGWQQGFFIARLHPAVMLVAAVVAHVGAARARRLGGREAWRTVGVAFLLALVLVTLAIPWQR